MLSLTKRALEDFDNQHDFERMSADLLNSLGYTQVEPMAPGGGSDGGSDIKFKDSESNGIAFVTLEKKVKVKFSKDLAKHKRGSGTIALFCNSNISPRLKIDLTKDALRKGYSIIFFDLERIRSLLDSSFKDLRKKYLHIDDTNSVEIKEQIKKIIKFPDSISNVQFKSNFERYIADQRPMLTFDFLINKNEGDLKEITEVGDLILWHRQAYYDFQKQILTLENALLSVIGANVKCQFRNAWIMYLQYFTMRFLGLSQDQIISRGNFLNNGVTWEDCERIYRFLINDSKVSDTLKKIGNDFRLLIENIEKIKSRLLKNEK